MGIYFTFVRSSKKMKILVLTRYSSLGASSRYRFYQYIPYFQDKGAQITIEPLLSDNYINYLYNKTQFPLIEIIRKYFERIFFLLEKNKYDIIWLQQEAFPWIPSFIETFLLKSKTPIVVDHDDAFFHRYDLHKSASVRKILGNKIDKTMRISNLVIVGNSYLAERAAKNNCKNIRIIPTVIDIAKYDIKEKKNISGEKFIAGWIGSPPNALYIKNIEESLEQFCNSYNGKLHLVGAGKTFLTKIPYENIEWNEETEVDEIKKFDVGIMPLIDSPWERGKCGFKLIQYMACGIPVVASPVGVNKELVKNGVNGFLAETSDDWLKYLKILKDNPDLRKEMGLNGRKLVEDKFTLQVNAPIIEKIFREITSPY